MTNEVAKRLMWRTHCCSCHIDSCTACYYNIAIKALEKLTPKKPYKNRLDFFCPNGDGHLVGKVHGKRSYYCEVCGQAIDWRD